MMENGRHFAPLYRANSSKKANFSKLAAILLAALLLVGCDNSEGSVEVDVGEAPLAAAYRVDIYADQSGLPLIEGQSLVQETVATFDEVPAGRWSVFIQAENGDHTTIGHFIGKIVVEADQVTKFAAGTYLPGLPGTPLPETDSNLPSFGPEGSALLSAIYGPGVDTSPPANVTLIAENGTGVAEVVETQNMLAKMTPDSIQGCATAWLAAQRGTRAQASPAPSPDRPNYGTLSPGQTTSFWIATTFEEATCARVLSNSQTKSCLIFAEVVDGVNVIDDATALEIAAGFDSDNPFIEGDTGVYADTRARYGSEWISNPVGGRDEDKRVILVFLSSDTIGGSGFFGFFNPQDELSQTEVSNSNEAEIIFINGDRANDDLYDALSTISHEFTHLILWNEKQGQDGTFPADAQPENTTIDEGLAVLNEDLSGFSFSGEQGGNFFLLSSVQDVLEEGLNRPFFQFQGGLGDYGAGYLLMRYVHDRFGPEKLREITTSPAVGRENIGAVVQQPFPLVFIEFGQAVALNGEPGVPEELSYNSVDLFGDYVDRDGESFDLNGLQGIGQTTLPGTVENQVTLEPWGSVFYRAMGGDGSALTWKATGVDSLLTKIYDSSGQGANPSPDPTSTPVVDPTP